MKYSNEDEQANVVFKASHQYHDGKFHNPATTNVWEFGKMWSALKEYASKRIDPVPSEPLPIRTIRKDNFTNSSRHSLRFSKLGHSTILLELGKEVWLTDPVFSERASPVQWAGPKRFHPVPVDLQELSRIEGVIISHNHYDHLDYASIQALKDQVKYFVVPLGIGNALTSWGVESNKIHELDWWQSKVFGNTEIVATPARHFSGRGILDGNKTLWSSWVIRNQYHNVYFSGDTGYFEGFKEIGERFGPFDVAFMECGAYHQSWRDIHMLPEDSLQAVQDVKGKLMVPVHNGTFDLSTHSWHDPMERITALAHEAGQPVLLPLFGQIVDVNSPPENVAWWRPQTKIPVGQPLLGLK